MSDDASLVSFSDTQLRYATGTLAVDEVSFTVARGEFIGVVGPSGCGKSTLLRLAAGLLAPTSGTLTRTTEKVGYVFQDPTLVPWRSVRRNVELVGELTGVGRAERRERALAALDRVGLREVANQRPATLSGGMRMRVSLARTLTAAPDLFLFDEPFAAVDEISRTRLGDDLRQLFTADRFGAIFVTHSVAEAVYLSTRVLVMSGQPGRVLGEIKVKLPDTRSPEIRYTNEFTTLTAKVHELLTRSSADRAVPVKAAA